jgi:hypothetical protein
MRPTQAFFQPADSVHKCTDGLVSIGLVSPIVMLMYTCDPPGLAPGFSSVACFDPEKELFRPIPERSLSLQSRGPSVWFTATT